MNASPANMPKHRTVVAPPVVQRPIYSTSTGQPTQLDREADYLASLAEDDDTFCFVCGRQTDHFAEHDDLVGAGLAEYVGGSVYLTERAAR